MALNIPDSEYPRIVIIGAGFGGLQLARNLYKKKFQIVIIDKNNYHQFQPLFYQVAVAGLEPSSIAFPLRKIFQKRSNVYIRPVNVSEILPDENRIKTEEGGIYYDILVIATGAKTNFFGLDKIRDLSFSLKNISEAIYLRNAIFGDLEISLTKEKYEDRQKYLDIAIVGGGPTGVEIAGSLVEMKNIILPKDYVELDEREVDIYLIQSGPRLLAGMSKEAGAKAKHFLEEIGVTVLLDTRVEDYDGRWVTMNGGKKLEAGKLIWCAGVKANSPEGLRKGSRSERNGRIFVQNNCRVEPYKNVYAIGDVAEMKTDKYPNGHPQVAQVAIQQATFLAKYLCKMDENLEASFVYKDKGSMATIGRNKAVVDLPKFKFSGWFAWIVWLAVHLLSLIGTRNKIVVMLNWFWNYMTYDQSLRLIIRPLNKLRKKE